MDQAMTLTRSEAREFYNRLGDRQDSQSWYEDAALDVLCSHAGFEEAQAVVEFGCGTGRLAARLLSSNLPSSASYRGLDQSATMSGLAKDRLAPFGDRVQVDLTDGSIRLGEPRSASHIVSTYVLDLLSEGDVASFLSESARILVPGGKLCLAGLTWGSTIGSRLVAGLWNCVFRIRPVWVGGCRPMDLAPYLSEAEWSIEHNQTVVARQLPSQVVIAQRR